MTKYYYMFLRKDLFPFGEDNPAYLIIQASHAAFEIARRLPTPDPSEPPTPMVLFEVENEVQLIETMRYLRFNGLLEGSDFYSFFEPDHETGFTAICTRPFEGRQRLFDGFRLFGAPPEADQNDLA